MAKRMLLVISALAVFMGTALAIPGQINYQGVLKDSSGNSLTGPYSMTFTIYDAATAGTNLWTETQTVTTEAGLYNVQLGAGTAISASVFNGDTRYLGVKVGTDAEMTPRIALISVPYAFRASVADSATSATTIADASVTTAKLADSAVTAAKITDSTITTAKLADSAVTAAKITDGTITAAKLANTYALMGANNYQTTSLGFGVAADSSNTTGQAIAGHASAASGANRGVYGQTSSTTGTGVYGEVGSSVTSGTNYGVYGASYSSDGRGVYGQANHASSINAIGVGGWSTAGKAIYGSSSGYLGYAGYFEKTPTTDSNPAVYIKGALQLTPEATSNVRGMEGVICVGKDNHIYCYLNGGWRRLDNE